MADDSNAYETSDGGTSYYLICPHWIDTDAYTDRDRFMFVCGVEFAHLMAHVRFADGPLAMPIHRENESRVRMLCGRFGRTCTITACEAGEDPEGLWSYLTIEAKE